MKPLGRRAPTDFEHVDKYPLTATTRPVKPVPVAIGVNWYDNFDDPQQDHHGSWWVGRGELGSVRGGHCVCLLPAKTIDPPAWRAFYNQGSEGACVGFGCSRMMGLLNRVRYDSFWLYHEARKVDEWPGEDYDGTSVRAALDVLRTQGHVRVGAKGKRLPPSVAEGISANRWATSVDDVLKVLGYPDKDYVEFANSWGLDYPRRTRMPASVLERLLNENGEFGLVTDR
jgi:hypothetical protein